MLSLLALCLVLQSPSLSVPPPVAIFSSYFDNRRWDFSISRAAVESQPRWDDTDDAPPLAPRAAVRSALTLLPTLLPNENLQPWQVQSVTLHHLVSLNAWFYIVAIAGPKPCLPANGEPGAGGCGFSGPPREMRMVVLLNGTAIVPASSPWTPNTPNRN